MAATPNSTLGNPMEAVANALHPLPAIVWGDGAIALHGAPIVCNHYMFVVRDADMEDASTKLQSSRFTTCSWSYGSLSPDFYTNNPVRERVYKNIVTSFAHLDQNSLRFFLPDGYRSPTKVVLLPSSYAHISFEHDGLDSMARCYPNILNPNGKLLVRSFVQTLLREPTIGMWTNTLQTWIVSYAYGELKLDMDILDDCEDEDAQAWFDNAIKRSAGGLDRVTQTKRRGRKGYDEKKDSTASSYTR